MGLNRQLPEFPVTSYDLRIIQRHLLRIHRLQINHIRWFPTECNFQWRYTTVSHGGIPCFCCGSNDVPHRNAFDAWNIRFVVNEPIRKDLRMVFKHLNRRFGPIGPGRMRP